MKHPPTFKPICASFTRFGLRTLLRHCLTHMWLTILNIWESISGPLEEVVGTQSLSPIPGDSQLVSISERLMSWCQSYNSIHNVVQSVYSPHVYFEGLTCATGLWKAGGWRQRAGGSRAGDPDQCGAERGSCWADGLRAGGPPAAHHCPLPAPLLLQHPGCRPPHHEPGASPCQQTPLSVHLPCSIAL